MSTAYDEKDNSIEEVKEVYKVESEEKVEEVTKKVVKCKIMSLENILQFLNKYLGCSNKRADIIISANKDLELESVKNEESVVVKAHNEATPVGI